MGNKGIRCMGCSGSQLAKPVKDGIGCENPVLKHALGICSALAVTGFVSTTLVMCLALLFVASISCMVVSVLSKVTPHRVRLIMQMLVISTLVIIVDQYLKAYHWDMSQALSVYVSLIITNCLILGRCEAYSMRNNPLLSFLDGLGAAAGYGIVLLIIAAIREPLGQGTLMGMRVTPKEFPGIMLVSAAPGAFLTMGVVAWIVRAIWPAETSPEHPEAGH